MVNKLIFVSIAVTLIVAAALIQGRWTNRWNDNSSERIQHFAQAIGEIPLTIETEVESDGETEMHEWIGSEPDEDKLKKARVEQRAGAEKIRTIDYRNAETGEVVTVMLVCGPSRDVSRHTPDACYVSQGYKMAGRPSRYKIGKGEFFTQTFRKGLSNLRIFWAWNPSGKFEVHNGDPRNVYGGRLPLNKIYLINRIPSEGQKPGKSPCIDFGKAFMKSFNQVVFTQSKDREATPDADS